MPLRAEQELTMIGVLQEGYACHCRVPNRRAEPDRAL